MIDCLWLNVPAQGSEPWREMLRRQARRHFQADGRLVPLATQDSKGAQEAIARFLQEPPPADRHWEHDILTWAQQLPDVRPTSPWTTEPLCIATGHWFMQASGKSYSIITDTADEAPWHPLSPVSLARLEPRPADWNYDVVQGALQPTFLARLTLKRLRDADEHLYGRDTLAEYAAWAAKIMHEKLHLNTETKEAINFALERTPPENQKALLDLKAQVENGGQ